MSTPDEKKCGVLLVRIEALSQATAQSWGWSSNFQAGVAFFAVKDSNDTATVTSKVLEATVFLLITA